MSITQNTKRRLSSLLAVPVLLLAITACTTSPGGSDSAVDQPSVGTMSASDWQVAFAGCMRDEGIDMPDPGADGSQGLSIDTSNQDALMAAAQKCQDKLGPMPPLSQAEQEAQDAEFQKAMLAAARCFRENGVDVADPKPGEGITVPDTAPQDIQEKCGAGMAQQATSPVGG